MSIPQELRNHTAEEIVKFVASLHENQQSTGGAVTGYCRECEIKWPCPTAHLANGWGWIDDCEEKKFCIHAGVKL